MVYFPRRPTAPSTPERCMGCGLWHIPTPGMENTSCYVLHTPGSCCHRAETEVPDPTTLTTENRT